MATIDEDCTFITGTDQVQFFTQTNGDSLHIKNLELTQDQATSLAWLVNSHRELVWTVSIKGGKPPK